MHYRQIAKLTTNYKGEVGVNRYERIFFVNKIASNEKEAYAYNKEFGIYFENPSLVTNVYEFEFFNVKVDFGKRLKKSQNFNRKLFYRYDFMQLKVNAQGRFVSILNKQELKDSWSRLKKRMLVDHKGDIVKQYLDKIDSEFTEDNKLYSALRQYLYFGLLFPYIPKSHRPDWEGIRTVEFSPYEKEKFEETTTISSIGEKDIEYTLTGTSLSGSSTKIFRYEGSIIKNKNEIFPHKGKLNTSIIRNNITSEWEFELHKI